MQNAGGSATLQPSASFTCFTRGDPGPILKHPSLHLLHLVWENLVIRAWAQDKGPEGVIRIFTLNGCKLHFSCLSCSILCNSGEEYNSDKWKGKVLMQGK